METMLTERFDRLKEEGKQWLLPLDEFHPYPHAEDRDAWTAVTTESRLRWLSLAERYIDYAWPALKASQYLSYRRDGTFVGYNYSYWERRTILGTLVLAECIEYSGRFLDQIVDGVMSICEETTWMPPQMNGAIIRPGSQESLHDSADHQVELFSSETAALLIWTRYLLKCRFDEISPRISLRIEREVNDRLLKPYARRDDYWWMGFAPGHRVNNWNPWCNGNALMGFLLLERDSESRNEAVGKIMRSLDVFLETYPPDGCCDEGPMYWGKSGGSLYDCLDLLHQASGGRIDIFGERIVKDIGAYLYKAHIAGPYYVNFADGDALVRPEGDVVYGFGRDIQDDNLIRLGASLPETEPPLHDWFSIFRHLRNLFQERERKDAEASPPNVPEAWMAHSQVMSARQKGDEGLFIAAKGGHNAESHNHNDVGHFIVYADGLPVLIDLGTEEYRVQTFSPQRYELWYLKSEYHNLPTVRGIGQQDGRQFRGEDAAFTGDAGQAEMKLRIEGAYPDEAGIEKWQRTFRLSREGRGYVEIIDDFRLRDPAADLYYSLMTPLKPIIAADGAIELEYAPNKRVTVTYDAEALVAKSEQIEIVDERLRVNWGDTVYRILMTMKQPVTQGKHAVKIIRGN
ncbi:heparinase II/III domain-containing protein [Cohnella herbarum]|uniref:Heparinase n=1 Tax=Cohnella herbarum TaxID=2728023 RepID=A0A7Z2VR46_9BACL|nr:heparinase II/III family protein [Cohnella herbarum]QJD87610.1 heparinase [Cohnella herbarum]